MTLLTRTGLRINRYCSMSDFPLFKMAAVRHLQFLKVGNFKFRSSSEAQYASSCQFREDWSNRSGDMADLGFLKRWRPSAILDFQMLKILTSAPVRKPDMRYNTKFRKNRSNRSGDMADFRLLKMAAVRHLGLVLRLLGPPTKSIWWSL